MCACLARSCRRPESYIVRTGIPHLVGKHQNWRSSMPANKSLVKNVARLHGYWIYRNLLSKSQYWSEERRQKYVMDNLRQTLVRASEGTAYYREQFNKAGFNPRID